MEAGRANGAPAAAGGELPLWALAAMIVAAAALTLGSALGSWAAARMGLAVVLSDGVMAGLVLLAAGGYGGLICRRWAGHTGKTLLGLATGVGVGLWLLGAGVLAAGSLLPGALSGWVWWPVVAVGDALALWQAHRPLGRMRLPLRLSGASLVWVVAAAAVGQWLAGAVLPAGWLGNLSRHALDVLQQHLQLPRQLYAAGTTRPLPDELPGAGPLGMEMLFLLAMCLRGGAYEGMYLAKMVPGLFGLVAVAAAFGGFGRTHPRLDEGACRDSAAVKPAPPDELVEDYRRRAAVALLATAPWLLYLSWVALAELAVIAYLVLTLMWLLEWLDRPSGRSAAWIGAALGASCAAAWSAVGMAAGPVLAVMLAAALRRPGRLAHVALAAAAAVLAASPYLLRAAATTGGTALPLAGPERDGEGSTQEVTAAGGDSAAPAGAERRPPAGPSRARRLAAFLLGRPPYNLLPPLGSALAAVLAGTVLAMFLRPRGTGRRDWAILAVLALQALAWAGAGGEMSPLAAAACAAPISLLCAAGLARLAGVRDVRWLRQSAGVGSRWGLAPATLLLAASAGMNVMAARAYWGAEIAGWGGGAKYVAPASLPAERLARESLPTAAVHALPPGSRTLVLGEGRAFYFPLGTVCVPGPGRQGSQLQDLFRRSGLSGPDLARRLRAMGLTHVLADWQGIERCAAAEPPRLPPPPELERLLADWPVVTEYPCPLPPSAATPATATAAAVTATAAATVPGAASATAAPAASAPAVAPEGERVFTLFAVPAPPATRAAPPGKASQLSETPGAAGGFL